MENPIMYPEQMEMMPNMTYPMERVQMIEQMYPECCKRVHPCVKMAVETMGEEKMHSITQEELNRMADGVMRKCNIHGEMPMGHNMQTMTDITKSLLIKELHLNFMRKEIQVRDDDPSVSAFAPFFPFGFNPGFCPGCFRRPCFGCRRF